METGVWDGEGIFTRPFHQVETQKLTSKIWYFECHQRRSLGLKCAKIVGGASSRPPSRLGRDKPLPRPTPSAPPVPRFSLLRRSTGSVPANDNLPLHRWILVHHELPTSYYEAAPLQWWLYRRRKATDPTTFQPASSVSPSSHCKDVVGVWRRSLLGPSWLESPPAKIYWRRHCSIIVRGKFDN